MTTVERLLKVMDILEERNDQSLTLSLKSDGSGHIKDFWSGNYVISFNDIDELEKILSEAERD